MSVRARGLRLSLGGREILGGVDLEAAEGEFVGITGPSGCGKTTFLQAVAGLLEPAAGTIEADRAKLAFVFQRPMLLPWRTVLDNAAFGLECRGVALGEARRRAGELLGQVGLSEFSGRLPHELSEGMKQRLSLARALLVKPRVLLLDEPFSALDAAARREIQDLLLAFWKKERFTVLFVSHWTEELDYLCGRTAYFSERPARVSREAPSAGKNRASRRSRWTASSSSAAVRNR